MESKGIVRRVDELGRIVLPREMRKSLNIRIGSKLEIGIVDGNKFLLSKYSDMASLKEYSDAVANAISVSIEHDVLISDMERILSSSKKKYLNKEFSEEVQELIKKKPLFMGEFGPNARVFKTEEDAEEVWTETVRLATESGFKGFAVWTLESHNQTECWNILADDGKFDLFLELVSIHTGLEIPDGDDSDAGASFDDDDEEDKKAVSGKDSDINDEVTDDLEADLATKTNDELKQICEEKGIDTKKLKTKSELIDAILA